MHAHTAGGGGWSALRWLGTAALWRHATTGAGHALAQQQQRQQALLRSHTAGIIILAANASKCMSHLRCIVTRAVHCHCSQVDALEFYPAVIRHLLDELLLLQQAARAALPRPAAIVTFRRAACVHQPPLPPGTSTMTSTTTATTTTSHGPSHVLSP